MLTVALLTNATMLQFVTHGARPAISYSALEVGVDAGLLGAVAATFAVVPLVGAIPLGRIADRGRVVPMLLLGSVSQLGAVAVLLLFSMHLPVLLGGSVLLGFSHICGVVAQQTLVSRVPNRLLDRAFSEYTLFGTAGQLAGPMLLTVSGHDTSPDVAIIFLLAGLGSLVVVASAIVLSILLRRLYPHAAVGSPTSNKHLTAARRFPERQQRAGLVASVVVSTVTLAIVDVVTIYLPAWGIEHHITAATVGMLLVLRSLGLLLGRVLVRPLLKIFSRAWLQTFSAIAAALTTAALALPGPILVAFTVLFLSGAAIGVCQPVSMIYVSATAPKGATATWLAIRLSGNSAGMLFGPPLAGLLAFSLGPSGVIVGTSLLAATICGAVAPAFRSETVRGHR